MLALFGIYRFYESTTNDGMRFSSGCAENAAERGFSGHRWMRGVRIIEIPEAVQPHLIPLYVPQLRESASTSPKGFCSYSLPTNQVSGQKQWNRLAERVIWRMSRQRYDVCHYTELSKSRGGIASINCNQANHDWFSRFDFLIQPDMLDSYSWTMGGNVFLPRYVGSIL